MVSLLLGRDRVPTHIIIYDFNNNFLTATNMFDISYHRLFSITKALKLQVKV